ncbi:hypothetical protein L210DRAFT_2981464 [Boletus edulis BED1]|uniref:Uncharacterized protein n=1 Tax=Boletus edulis BED1 TaxID=1328754 RepID=A0AAD4BIY5_BOLED|nr:hypothetical protein L210DRAFT_2981464 [Boletus edulis BED1]
MERVCEKGSGNLLGKRRELRGRVGPPCRYADAREVATCRAGGPWRGSGWTARPENGSFEDREWCVRATTNEREEARKRKGERDGSSAREKGMRAAYLIRSSNALWLCSCLTVPQSGTTGIRPILATGMMAANSTH